MTVQIVFVIALLIGSALFSASEMALSSANRMRLAAAAEEGSRGRGRRGVLILCSGDCGS